MKRILTITLALAMLLAFTVPAFGEGTDISSENGQEAAGPVQQPEEPPTDDSAGETPDAEPSDPNPTPGPEEPSAPGDSELPDVSADPAPDIPEGPDVPETPVEDEQPPAGAEEIPDELEPEPVQEPVIDVIVPQNGQVVINPYQLQVDLPDGSVSYDQIINPIQTLINFSTVPVQVDAWVVGSLSPESTAQFVDFAPLPDTHTKEIFMYAEFQTDPSLWSDWYGDMPNQILVSAYGASKVDVMTLDLEAEGYFRLFGAMTDNPDEIWGSEDAPNVTVTFGFTPVVGEEVPPAQMDIPVEDAPEEDIPAGDIPVENVPAEDVPVEDVPTEAIPESTPELLPSDDTILPLEGPVFSPDTEVDYAQ